MYNTPVKGRREAEKHCDSPHERVKVRLSILSYPINRDTRAIYFTGSYPDLSKVRPGPSYLFPCHRSPPPPSPPVFTVNSHKSLKISPVSLLKGGRTYRLANLFTRVPRVRVHRGRDSSRCARRRLTYLRACVFVSVRARARTKSYVTWKFQRFCAVGRCEAPRRLPSQPREIARPLENFCARNRVTLDNLVRTDR